jgi:hypothetical protein
VTIHHEEIIAKEQEYTEIFQKLSSPEPVKQFQSNL